MTFSFGFSGDDIEEDPNDVSVPGNQNEAGTEDVPPPIEARAHDLDELLSHIPDKLSYSTITITSPKGHTARLPRREIFDIRLQLMAEDSLGGADSSSSSQAPQLTGLDATDLQPNVYEGGYKTWECSLDLCSFLLDRGPRKDLDDLMRVGHVVELGCGSALPSLLLWQYAFRSGWQGYFTLGDYNVDVLRLATVPNLLLAWVGTLGAREGPFAEGEENPLAEGGEDEGELYVTPEILEAFKTAVKAQGIVTTLVSGSWVPVARLLDLVPSAPELNTLILGSETIYSPASLEAFTEAITELMKRVKSGKTVVAAKRVYFGVGGSVDGFREECSKRGCVAYEIEFEGLEKGGVRRCLVEVQMY
ncbi:hypothetical protein BS50DRAFT_377353 [Corynespora cassiicola Philippines]|uniref:protein-histidine N-methyltransferase n=1 Tax=Corynespora cassiicola Philippines TaxID=1448308 RepID=A0A2T2NN81_CORCC|nr:hypothetical protein BS50DRAFT_377353 [Corynespora cassiicola Philippines]